MPPSRLGQFGLWLQRRHNGGSTHARFVLPEGKGPLLAFCASPDASDAARQIQDTLCHQHPDLRFFDMSPVDGPNPATDRHACHQALEKAKPFAILLLGNDLPAALVTEAAVIGIPIIVAGLHPDTIEHRLSLRAAMRRELLGKISMLLVPDAQSKTSLRRQGVPANQIIITGPFSQTYKPLPYNEAERSAIAELFHGRHSWFAVCVPPSEEDAVIAAHHAALRQSHLALLLLLPSDISRIEALAARIEQSGLVVARRDFDEEPTEDVQVFIVDSLNELGLWYRLAPVTFIGGTLSGDNQHSRHPFEPAALGSAIVHGPKIGRFTDAWKLLINAKATRSMTRQSEIAAAAAELSQPDLVANLANKAWTVSTDGAAVSIEVATAVLSYLEEAKA